MNPARWKWPAGSTSSVGGKFRYALSYGAVDEEGEGDWTSDGRTVRLTSNPMPKGPTFELVRDDPAPNGSGVDDVRKVQLQLDRPGRRHRHRRGHDRPGIGDRLVRRRARRSQAAALLTSIEPLVPVYATPGGAVRLGPERGHRLLFRFHPNDLGRAAFKGQLLTSNGSALLLDRYDTNISLFAGPDLQGAGESEACPIAAAR